MTRRLHILTGLFIDDSTYTMAVDEASCIAPAIARLPMLTQWKVDVWEIRPGLHAMSKPVRLVETYPWPV